MEDQSSRFRLAVQWHPEHVTDHLLFEALVTAARAYAAGLGPALLVTSRAPCLLAGRERCGSCPVTLAWAAAK